MLTDFYSYLRYELNRAPLTLKAYQTDIDQFLQWYSPEDLQGAGLSNVTSSDIRRWIADKAREGDTPRTIRRKVTTLRTLFKWMVKTEKIKVSPLSQIPLPKIAKPLPDLIKPEELENVITTLANDAADESASNVMKALVVEMLYTLGIRRAELTGIHDRDISFTNAEIKVTGKRSKQRVIPVPEKLLQKIRNWQRVRDEEYGTANGDGALFIHKGKRISVDHVYRIVHEALGATNARKKSPHALRHSFASGMLNGGAEIDSVREFLGHASLATTQIYTHISLKEIRKAYSGAHPRSENKKG